MRLRNWCKSRRIPNAAMKGPNTAIIRVSEGTSNTSEMILEPSEQVKEAGGSAVRTPRIRVTTPRTGLHQQLIRQRNSQIRQVAIGSGGSLANSAKHAGGSA